MIKITEEHYIKDLLFYVELSDGSSGLIDFTPLADKFDMFKQIVSEGKQANYFYDGYTFEWYNGADIAPEWIRDHLIPSKKH